MSKGKHSETEMIEALKHDVPQMKNARRLRRGTGQSTQELNAQKIAKSRKRLRGIPS